MAPARPASAGTPMQAGGGAGGDPPTASGRVLDAATGDPVVGATVVLQRVSPEGAGPERRAVTDSLGHWDIVGLPAGTFELSAEHIGFATVRGRLVQVPGDDELLRITLTPRAVLLDALVVIASRRPERLADSPVPTELIGRMAVERAGGAGVDRVLTEQLGIDLQGGHPTGSGIMLQGIDSRRILVLLDGQPYSGQVGGVTDVSRIPSAVVERIEVVKGPQSTLYGSEAMGGVVNIVTRPPGTRGVEGSATVTVGNEGRLDGTLFAAGGAGRLRFNGGGGRRRASITPGVAGLAGTETGRSDAFARTEYPLGTASVLRASALATWEDQRWRVGQLRYFADNIQFNGLVSAAWSKGAHRFEPSVALNRFDHLSRRGTADAPPPRDTGARQIQQVVKAQALYGFSVNEAWQVDAGAELRREHIEAEAVADGYRRRTIADLFAQATWTQGRVSLVPGVRLTRNSAHGEHIAPRLAALVRAGDQVSLRASVGSGYRAPDFKEQYLVLFHALPGFTYMVRGDPGLVPEVSTHGSLSAEWAPDRFYARVTAFYNDFENFIETGAIGDSAGVTLFGYRNVQEGLTRGIEAEAGATAGGFRTEAGVTLLEAKDRASGQRLLGRPEVAARARVSYSSPLGLSVSASAVHTGETVLNYSGAGDLPSIAGLPLPGGDPIPREAFTRLDARISQQLPGGIDLRLGVDNVLNQVPDNWPGYAGRLVHMTAGLHLR